MATGLALAQIGEFSFVLLELGHRQGLVSFPTFQVLLSASVLTLVLTPYVIAAAPRLSDVVTPILSRSVFSPPRGAHPAGGAGHISGHVIIVGFGPAGQRVAETLRRAAIPFVVVDLNPRTVVAHRATFPVEFGDATRPEILHHLGIRDSRAVLVTVPAPQTAELIIRQAKRTASRVPVIVRSRYHAHVSTLLQAGADHLVMKRTLWAAD